MTTISHIETKKLILAHLAGSPNGVCTSNDAKLAVLALLGGDPKLTHDINCISNARSDLKAAGLVADGTVRGEWVLTPAGRAVHEGAPMPKGARSAPKTPRAPKTPDPAPAVESSAGTGSELAKVDGETAPAVVTTDITDAPAGETPAPIVETPAPTTKRRLKVADATTTAVVVPEWLGDAEVRGAVIENQDCFGAFSARSPACGECALAGFCRNAKAAQLDLLARKLLVANPLVNTPVPGPVAKLDGAVSDVLDPNAARAPANPTGGTIRATYDGVCGESGRPIKKGDTVRYVQGKGVVLVD